MEVLNHLRSSFRSRTTATGGASRGSVETGSPDSNNNSDAMHKKRTRHDCDLCGKRLLKLAGWRNYFTLPCKCRHVFCKQCITGRLQCRQKVLRSASFNMMWTFPCPGNAQCGQQLTVDFSRGSSYSKNLVARDLASVDNSLEPEGDEEVDDEGDNVLDGSDVNLCGQDGSIFHEIG